LVEPTESESLARIERFWRANVRHPAAEAAAIESGASPIQQQPLRSGAPTPRCRHRPISGNRPTSRSQAAFPAGVPQRQQQSGAGRGPNLITPTAIVNLVCTVRRWRRWRSASRYPVTSSAGKVGGHLRPTRRLERGLTFGQTGNPSCGCFLHASPLLTPGMHDNNDGRQQRRPAPVHLNPGSPGHLR